MKEEQLEEAWFWSRPWQAAEGEADEDLKQGRYQEFGTVQELLEDLHHED